MIDEFFSHFELIGDDIAYEKSNGFWREQYADKYFIFQAKVFSEMKLKTKECYYIANWEKLEGSSWKARKAFIDGVKEINKKYQFKFGIVFGLNNVMNLFLNISKQFVPFSKFTAKSLDDALNIIRRKRGKVPIVAGIEKKYKEMK